MKSNSFSKEEKTINSNAKIILIIGVAGVVIFPILFSLPAFLPIFDLSSKGEIGSAIGGTTAPLIGLVTAVLMYYAFRIQYLANYRQWKAVKENQEFLTLNSLYSELKESRSSVKISDLNQIHNALNDVLKNHNVRYENIRSINKLNDLENTIDTLLIYMQNFSFLSGLIHDSEISNSLKESYRLKFKSLYRTNFGRRINALEDLFDKWNKLNLWENENFKKQDSRHALQFLSLAVLQYTFHVKHWDEHSYLTQDSK